MKLTLKLYAGLSEYLPEDAVENVTKLEIPSETTANGVIDLLNVPREMTHLILLNGIYLNPKERDIAKFTDGDTLAIWPPVAGG